MHEIIADKFQEAQREGDLIPEGFELESSFLKQCATDLGTTTAVVKSLLAEAINAGEAERQKFKSAGVEGFQIEKTYVRKSGKKEK